MSSSLQPVRGLKNPTYARSVDMFAHTGRYPKQYLEFSRALPKVIVTKGKEQGKDMILFNKLWPSIRHKVYGHVFDISPRFKAVTLSKDFATKDVFPPDYFVTPWEILYEAEGAMLSCRQMRDDILTYFWQTYRFHVTFSPFTTGPTFSGLSVKWLNLYADRIAHLAVEVDLTKLSFAAAKDANRLKPTLTKISQILNKLASGILRRKPNNVMADLHLMVRRYEGFRPVADDAVEGDLPIPHCPDSALHIFDAFERLEQCVLRLRMSGFTRKYAKEMMETVYKKELLYGRVESPAWPDYVPPTPNTPFYNPLPTPRLQLTSWPSLGTSDEDSQDTLSSGSITPTASSASIGYFTPNPSSSSIGQIHSRPGSTLAVSRPGSALGNSKPGSTLGSSRPGSSLAISRASSDSGETSDSVGLGISLDLRASPSFTEEVEGEIAKRAANHPPRSDSLQSGSKSTVFTKVPHSSESTESLETPLSPNTMNRLNEKDPAFNRAFEAMRLDSEEKADEDQEMEKNFKNEKKKKGKKH